MALKCAKCFYEWTPRVSRPKKCPRCQRWLVAKPIDEMDLPDVMASMGEHDDSRDVTPGNAPLSPPDCTEHSRQKRRQQNEATGAI